MEILDNQFAQEPGADGLQVTRNMKINWLSTAKWAMFLTVITFIYLGFAVLPMFVVMPMMGTALAMSGQSELAGMIESTGTVFIIFALAVLGVMFMITLFHLRFSTGIQRAIQYDSQEAFESAWRNLRNYFRWNGIITIAMIAIYVIALIFLGSMAASRPDF
ncbi:MAG: hypothetical protein OHK0019_22980 [Saprospiraceae bacterium]